MSQNRILCLYIKVYALRGFQRDLELFSSYTEISVRLDQYITDIEKHVNALMTEDEKNLVRDFYTIDASQLDSSS